MKKLIFALGVVLIHLVSFSQSNTIHIKGLINNLQVTMNGNLIPNRQTLIDSLPSGNYQLNFLLNEGKEARDLIFKLTGNDSVVIYVNLVKEITKSTLFRYKRNAEINSGVKKKPMIFFVVEQMPEYPGGEEAFKSYIISAIERVTTNSNEKGMVIIQYIIDEHGKATTLKILKSDNENLNDEAIEIINGMQEWVPGSQRGKPVRVQKVEVLRFE